jgi:hypothetical protein
MRGNRNLGLHASVVLSSEALRLPGIAERLCIVSSGERAFLSLSIRNLRSGSPALSGLSVVGGTGRARVPSTSSAGVVWSAPMSCVCPSGPVRRRHAPRQPCAPAQPLVRAQRVLADDRGARRRQRPRQRPRRHFCQARHCARGGAHLRLQVAG